MEGKIIFASSKDRREGEQCAKSYRKFPVKYQKGDQPMVSWKQNELRERGGKEKKVKKKKEPSGSISLDSPLPFTQTNLLCPKKNPTCVIQISKEIILIQTQNV